MEEGMETEKLPTQQKQKFQIEGRKEAPLKQSKFLIDRVEGRGHKYFDSGDYNVNMAKSKQRKDPHLASVIPKAIPKLPRKPSTSKSNLLADGAAPLQSDEKIEVTEEEREEQKSKLQIVEEGD